MGNKVKREELGCLYHEINSSLLNTFNSIKNVIVTLYCIVITQNGKYSAKVRQTFKKMCWRVWACLGVLSPLRLVGSACVCLWAVLSQQDFQDFKYWLYALCTWTGVFQEKQNFISCFKSWDLPNLYFTYMLMPSTGQLSMKIDQWSLFN